VPLQGKGRILGALAIDNRSGGAAFGRSDERLLAGVASVASIALENARLVQDLRNSRQHVMRAERLGTLGTLAAGLAHEINNPLVSIHTFLSLVPEKRKEDDPEFWSDYYRLACQEVDRIRGLVATMSRLGRSTSESPRFAPCDVGALVGEVITLLGREASKRRVELGSEIDLAVGKVFAVREQIHQVVLNLALNALQASDALAEVRIRVYPGGPGGREGVTIEVVDSGHGIAEEDLDRIFDPFFTTKGPAGGTGLGLMISHRIVADHGGAIEVSSHLGHGSTFRVKLPAEPPEPDESDLDT
jgi:signal transduction histidine kinase